MYYKLYPTMNINLKLDFLYVSLIQYNNHLTIISKKVK